MSVRALPPRVDVVGSPISLTSYDEVVELLRHPPVDRALVVAVCNVHSVMSARRNRHIYEAIATADVATSDGQPVVWAIRAMYRPDQSRVYGPDLMRAAIRARGLCHYLYGSTDETLQVLTRALQRINPEAAIVGRHSPPFRDLTPEELDADADRIRRSGANVVWVGLGMPKQELWMHAMRHRLPGIALVGVGAAFDLLSGRVPQAPPLLQRLGLEWAFRLVQEPRRLWRRYIFNNPAYLVLLAGQLVRHRSRAARSAPDHP